MDKQDFPVLNHVDLTQRVYQVLRQKILTLELRPGSRLDLRRVARAMGVSVTPVKAAFDRLAREGLLRIEPYRGTYVSPVHLEEIQELYGVRAAYELYAAEVGCRQATASQLEELKRAWLARDEWSHEKPLTHAQLEALVDAESAFHLCLVRLGGNGRLLALYEALNLPILLLRRANLPRLAGDRGADVRQEHRAIFEAYYRRDIEALRHAIGKHIDNSILRMKRRLQQMTTEATAETELTPTTT